MGNTSGAAGYGEGAQETLSDLLRHWRARAAPRRSGRRRGLSQKEVALLADVSERWYGELERGQHANYSAKFLDSVASVLKLSEPERRTLYLHAIGRPPAPIDVPNAAEHSIVDDSMRRLLDRQHPNPAFLTDRAWTIIGHNRAQRDWFPWVLDEPNVMRWAFLHGEAREQLVNWREDWASLFLALLRFAHAENPDNQAVRQLVRDILAGNPEAREIWDLHEVREHTSGVECHLRVPYHRGEEAAVRIMAFAPLLNTQLRFVVLLKID